MNLINMLQDLGKIDDNLMPIINNEPSIYKPSSIEHWLDVPNYLICGEKDYQVSDKGRVKLGENIIKTQTTHLNSQIPYQVLKINECIIYLHDIVYRTFNPNIPLYKKIHFNTYSINIAGMLDCNIEYLNAINEMCLKANICEKPIQYNHPIYGSYYAYKWLPLIGHLTRDKQDIITTYNNYEIMIIHGEIPCIIRNSTTQNERIIKCVNNKDPNLSLRNACSGEDTGYQLTHLMLISVFPHVKPATTVDHMDGNHHNHDLLNLVWLSWSENSAKDNYKKTPGDIRGREIEVIFNSGMTKIFPSIASASRYINFLTEPLQIYEKDSIENHIRDVANGIRKSARGFNFRWIDHLLPEEIWIPDPINPIYLISNKARFKKGNRYLHGCKGRNSHYSTIWLGRKEYVHIIVYKAFNGEIPDGMDVAHNDSLIDIKDKYGYYRNHLSHLRLKNRSDNMKEYHETKIK